MNDGYTNLVEEVKRLEEMLLDLGEHFRCEECRNVFHVYDRYASLNELDECEEKYCEKCGPRAEQARADEAETYEYLRSHGND